ncbi:hypothetical protein GDO81_016139 [Engystomops pustulosus]|uniref:Uncharacterized protein n=1 Tax=Engystomops pustulosus TaxID=76066 RepID=A0AAV7APY3_ENGPU|nr:hypothetical protein GDO81_016139 [Engystomops pustulosus]
MSFGALSERRNIQAHKKMAQMRFFTIFIAFGIFFPLPSTWHGIFNTIIMKCNLLRRKQAVTQLFTCKNKKVIDF